MNPSIVIKTGGSFGPRQHKINFEDNPPNKYALLHIRIRNDWEYKDTRTIFVYYSSDKKSLLRYSNNAEKDFDEEAFINFEEVWIDEWVRRRNGDLYKLYKISNVEEETPKVMLKRIKNRIRGGDEEYFELSENQIYRFDRMDSPLPNKFKIYQCNDEEYVADLFGY